MTRLISWHLLVIINMSTKCYRSSLDYNKGYVTRSNMFGQARVDLHSFQEFDNVTPQSYILIAIQISLQTFDGDRTGPMCPSSFRDTVDKKTMIRNRYNPSNSTLCPKHQTPNGKETCTTKAALITTVMRHRPNSYNVFMLSLRAALRLI